ncbi:MAG: SpoIIE family protein phosphatase [Candidatus Gastranaerophilales bacterium]|nr:SpoIIE family protein phosphatase [Candidatus Gastranaerophilales bacterium]
MFIDIACSQKKKYNQNAYGDYFASNRFPNMNRIVAVLSDGLGSGIKANILACMTSTMLLKFMENHSDIEKSCEIIMNSLPVCKIRGISYSTFSAIDCFENGKAKIVEEGNPDFIWIRNNEVLKPEFQTIQSKDFKNRKMKFYDIQLERYDRIIFCSDGATQVAMGSKEFPLGLERSGLIKIILKKLEQEPEISSKDLSDFLIKQIQYIAPKKELKDDTSIVSIYCRDPRESLIFTGPPYHSEKDSFYANNFINFKGKKAISGGTTANIISRELNIPVSADLSTNTGKLPGLLKMEGVDLVTEGILTLTKTLEYLKNEKPEKNAAKVLMDFLLDSDVINFLVGAQVNKAHYDPSLPIEIEIRKNIIKQMAQVLEEKYLKKVNIQFI